MVSPSSMAKVRDSVGITAPRNKWIQESLLMLASGHVDRKSSLETNWLERVGVRLEVVFVHTALYIKFRKYLLSTSNKWGESDGNRGILNYWWSQVKILNNCHLLHEVSPDLIPSLSQKGLKVQLVFCLSLWSVLYPFYALTLACLYYIALYVSIHLYFSYF